MKKLCIYHNADQDGFCSAAIVRKVYPDCLFYGMQYGDKLPDIAPDVDLVMIVDFSLPMEEMEALENRVSLIWIDHHITAIEDYEQRDNLVLTSRLDPARAACELTWLYFYPTKPVPTAVKLVGSYDVWNHEDPDVVLFHYGMESTSIESRDSVWEALLDSFPATKLLVGDLIYKGRIIQTYQKALDEGLLQNNSYRASFEGLECLVVNTSQSPSLLAKLAETIYTYEAFVSFCYIGDKWRVSLRSYNEEVNVSKIAKRYGGGGHIMSASFNCKELPAALIQRGKICENEET